MTPRGDSNMPRVSEKIPTSRTARPVREESHRLPAAAPLGGQRPRAWRQLHRVGHRRQQLTHTPDGLSHPLLAQPPLTLFVDSVRELCVERPHCILSVDPIGLLRIGKLRLGRLAHALSKTALKL